MCSVGGGSGTGSSPATCRRVGRANDVLENPRAEYRWPPGIGGGRRSGLRRVGRVSVGPRGHALFPWFVPMSGSGSISSSTDVARCRLVRTAIKRQYLACSDGQI